MFQGRQGLLSLLKDGGRHFSGLEEATLRNIDACKKLAAITKTSLGPDSMNKLIVSHIEKLFVTSDAATLIEQLEVQHPAAKIVAAAAKMQEQECGDGTNLVVSFAGELLNGAGGLLNQGIHSADIIRGYELALEKVTSILPQLATYKAGDIQQEEAVAKAILTAVSSKALGHADTIARLVAEAALITMPANPARFSEENVRVAKLSGGSPGLSRVVKGLVVLRSAHGSVKSKENCKVMVLGCGLEISSTEAKGTVLLNNAAELLDFSRGEESRMDATIRAIADAGIGAIVVGGNISDLAQHFCNKYDILTLKVQSKYELQRLCRTLRASCLVKLAVPSPEETGFASSIQVQEVSSKYVTVVSAPDSKLATIVLRGSMGSSLDELERAVDDGVAAVRALVKDNRFIPGGGATENELAFQLQQFGATLTGLEQYAVMAYAEALDVVPRVLADNAGLRGTEVVTQLYAMHAAGQKAAGVDVDVLNATGAILGDVTNRPRSDGHGVEVTPDAPILDHYLTKECALKLATDAAVTVLRVDQIIMARPAGGPKPRKII